MFSRHVVFEGEPLGQLPYAGAEKHVVELLKRGRISVFPTVELPDRSLYEVYEFGPTRLFFSAISFTVVVRSLLGRR
ncbi:MAG: hypothetical protein M3M97_05170 [Actinomycetota bacterium]|nr:hypothetical protein [Actinomycetota bacterium]